MSQKKCFEQKMDKLTHNYDHEQQYNNLFPFNLIKQQSQQLTPKDSKVINSFAEHSAELEYAGFEI